MLYRRFGKTNLNLSVFSLGTMRLSSPSVMIETVKCAIASGINHIETARSYGRAEDYLRVALESVSNTNLYITTKLTPCQDKNRFADQLESSFDHLGLNYIDSIAIHGINKPEHLEWVIKDQGCYEVIQEAIAANKVGYVGFSTHGSLELILTTIKTGLFDFINLHYYYFFQRNYLAIELAQQLDLGIFIISPSDKGGKLYNPPNKLRELTYPLTPLDFNYNFLLNNPNITTLSIGPANPEELIAAIDIINHEAISSSTQSDIINKLEQTAINELGTDYCNQCYQCLPCPEGINIPEVLRLRNLSIAYDMSDYGKYRYQMFENAGHWFWGNRGDRCSDCGDCLPRCPMNLDIPTLLRDTHDKLKGRPRRRLWD